MRAGDNVHHKGICVLVDRLIPSPDCTEERARTSLWKDVLSFDSFDEVSVSDEKTNKRQVRINAARVAIVNWDAANGDYMCGSDDTFTYFLTRQDRRDALLQNGGTILCEFQSGRGQPYQGAYDAIFGAEQVEVVDATIPMRDDLSNDAEGAQWNNVSVHFSKYGEKHPVTRGIEPSLRSRYSFEGPLFNFNKDRPQETFYWYRYRYSIYNGWFTNWQKGWVPLLIADLRTPRSWFSNLFEAPPAVLLAKCQHDGLMLASTMWIAGSGCKELVDNIVNVRVSQIKKTHRYLMWRRSMADILAGLVLCSLVLFLLNHFPNARGSLLGDLGVFWATLILFRLWFHLVWRRPFGVSILQYSYPGVRAFWETI